MNSSKTRGVVLACGVALVLLGMPARSEACQCLDWIWPWNWCRGTAAATTFQPAYAAPSCPPTQTCSYVPQTAYRSVSRMTPMTTCRPVTTCDPCTGCPVTSYQPMTSMVRTTQLIPYTTYRMVWSNPCTPSVSSCGTGCAPTYAAVSTVGSGCGSCAAPSTSAPYLGPSTTMPPPTTSMPSTPSGGTTYKAEKPIIDAPLAPIPDSDTEVRPQSFKNPQLIDPVNQTTARPIQRAGYYQPVSRASSVDFGGWRASGD